ncbi:MAG: DNA alkylation repair protein [Porphyromonadaceae bacterium]|jgi:3-methyladenine DNA glycosylase AlkD|nr:DNA alkylation repair protein [Porphyromonadaceae bacterium]
MTVSEIITELKSLATEDHLQKMKGFGTDVADAYGVKVPFIRQLAKRVGKYHALAMELRKSNAHEARMMAYMNADYKLITEKGIDACVREFRS